MEFTTYCDPLFISKGESWRPEKFTKKDHPLNIIVSKEVMD